MILKYALLIFAALIVITLAYDSISIYFLIKKTVALEHLSPFNRPLEQAPFRILVLGDSTAVGTGATTAEDSTAGRLAKRYPQAEVVNLAVNGLRIDGLEQILNKRDIAEKFDIVLIQIGANDIIRFTSIEDIEAGIKRILDRSKLFGGQVIVLHSGNIGESIFFPWYVRPILSKRSHQVREIYQRVVPTYGASYVDLINAPVADKLREDPEVYYAADLLHLSSLGYELWYEEISKKIQ